MELIQFSSAASRIEMQRSWPVKKRDIPYRLPRETQLRDRIAEINSKLIAAQKRTDYIGKLFRTAIFLAIEIIDDPSFEVLDIHTVKIPRKAVSFMKALRECSGEINRICDSTDRVGRFNSSEKLLDDIRYAVPEVFHTDFTRP